MSTKKLPTSLPCDAVDASAVRRKTFDLTVKADDLRDDGEFTVYAAVFGNLDRQGDVIEPGAFANLNEFAADGVGLVNHDMMALPVAWIETASQDGTGLRVSGRFHSTPEAQACRTVIKERLAAGKSVKCSIGFRVLDYAIEQRAQGQAPVVHLTKINVYEFSFVNVPANPLAGVVSAKSSTPEVPMPPNESPESPRVGMLDSIKEWLGFSTKAGRAISKANHAALKSFADQMLEHGKNGSALAKSMKEYAAGCKAIGEAMHGHLSQHDPDKPAKDDDTDDDEASDDDGDEPKKPEKSIDISAAERLRLLKIRAAELD